MKRPQSNEVIPLARAYKAVAGNESGGSLHIVLDDYNVEDGNIDFCIQYAAKEFDAMGMALGLLLRSMTKTQRLKVAKST